MSHHHDHHHDHHDHHHDHGHSHGGHSHHHMVHNHEFKQDLQKWIARLESPERIAESKIPEVMAFLQKALLSSVPEEEGKPRTFALSEIGAGTGIWTFHLAEYFWKQLEGTKHTLKVFASDPSELFVKHMESQLLEKYPQLKGIFQPILSSETDPKFKTQDEAKNAEQDILTVELGGMDLIAFNNTLHHIEDRIPYMKNLQKWLKPNGIIFMQDFSPEPSKVGGGFGPPVEHRLSQELVDKEMLEAGFEPVKELQAGLKALDEITPHHYNLVYRLIKKE